MTPYDIKVGFVYRYRRLGNLFLVTSLLDVSDFSRGEGAHTWLKLTGDDAGKVGHDNGIISVLAEASWCNFQRLDLEAGDEQ